MSASSKEFAELNPGTIASASEFIPVAEQFGLAKLVDHRALELAIELLHSASDIKLALNVSAATATDPQWLQGLEAYFGKGTGLAERLTIEITETAAISDLQEIDGSFIQNLGAQAEDELFVRTPRASASPLSANGWAMRRPRKSWRRRASPTCRAISSARPS
ncbi:MAG TPA: EAL domain-containing protein [Methyloceanibacter sp.]